VVVRISQHSGCCLSLLGNFGGVATGLHFAQSFIASHLDPSLSRNAYELAFVVYHPKQAQRQIDIDPLLGNMAAGEVFGDIFAPVGLFSDSFNVLGLSAFPVHRYPLPGL
jgi:hypothetical protein